MECDECGTAFDVFEGFYPTRSQPGRSSLQYERRCLDCATWKWLRSVDHDAERRIEPHIAMCDRCGILDEFPSAGGGHVSEANCGRNDTDWKCLKGFGE
jgi:hypothetical protein